MPEQEKSKISTDTVILIIASIVYILGLGLIYPGLFQLLFKRTKRSLAIAGIYWLVLTPLSWILMITIVGILALPFLYLVFYIPVIYDAYLIYKGRKALFES